MNENGEPLYFGILSYCNTTTTTSTFCAPVKPRDVKAALVMLTYLFLGHHTVEDLVLFDSSMLLIKELSEGAGVHFNSIGKPNCIFAWFVVDFLAMSILFDSFINHRLLVAPMPFKKVPLSEANMAKLVHNKQILIKFCLCQGLSRVAKYILNKKTGDIGRGCLNLDKLWSTSTKFYRQLHASSFQSYTNSYTGPKKEQKLWIHHFVFLKLFHPLFCFYPGEECDLNFKDDNHNLFLEKMTQGHLEKYSQLYGDSSNYSWVWMGEGGKIRFHF